MQGPARKHVVTASAIAVTLAALQACTRSPAARPRAERVFVSNEDSGDISVIDVESSRVVGSIPVGKRPRGLRLRADGKELYVALSGSPKGGPNVDETKLPPPDRSADGIGVVDVASQRLLRILSSGADPEAFDLVGDRLVVSNEDTARASIVRVATGKVEASIPVGDEPEGVRTRPDGRVTYVTSEAANEVFVIDTATAAVIARLEVGKRPRAIVFTADGARAYVTNELSPSVSAIDARTHRVVQTIQIEPAASGSPAPRPMGAVISPDGARLYITTGRGGGLVEIDTRSQQVTRTLHAVGARPWGVGITGNGETLYVANGPSDDVAVVDVRNWRVVKRIAVGRSPWGIEIGSPG
jgi:YVTN family beta-propeller protein